MAVAEDKGLSCPGECGSGGEREHGRERGDGGRRSAIELYSQTHRTVGERGGDRGPCAAGSGYVDGGAAVAGGGDGAGGETATKRGASVDDGVDDRDTAGGVEIGVEGENGKGYRNADGDRARGRGDEGERVARACVVAEAAVDDGGSVVNGQVVHLDID